MEVVALVLAMSLPPKLVAPLVLDGINARVETRHVPFQGYTIQYQHRLWRIDFGSVCANMDKDSSQYRRCRQAAKMLFQQLCADISNSNYKSMYCQAARFYRPFITSSDPAKTDPRLMALKRRCGDLRIQALEDKSKVAERDRVCAEYEGLLGDK
ncbi:hypothetical protein [Gallaecimonas sp. GXIMD1310]|uniref:hypothetical protein n=1 Tax=Gallaecimonas sp. GXIMD1310 TaxID=3131926 RepID=UPI003244536B